MCSLLLISVVYFFFFSSRRRHTRCSRDWSSDVCSSDLRALVNRPALLLADEPTGNLDSRTSIEVMSIFQELNEQGLTVLLVTHESDIAEHARRVVTFKDGVVLSDGPLGRRRLARDELQASPEQTA